MSTGPTVLGVDLPSSSPRQGLATLGRIADAYDACLAALPGLYWVNDDPRACLAGDEEHGQLVLLVEEAIHRSVAQHRIAVRVASQENP